MTGHRLTAKQRETLEMIRDKHVRYRFDREFPWHDGIVFDKRGRLLDKLGEDHLSRTVCALEERGLIFMEAISVTDQAVVYKVEIADPGRWALGEMRLTPRQRETLEEIRDYDVEVDRCRCKWKNGTTTETWTWRNPLPVTDMSARELKRLRLLEKRGLIEMYRILHEGFLGCWTTQFAIEITDRGMDALLLLADSERAPAEEVS